MRAGELMDNERNWRIHPLHQQQGVAGIMEEHGKVDVLKAYYSERAGGKLVLLDGHLRKSINPNEEWQVAVLDINDAEADQLLALYDSSTNLAVTDPVILAGLLEEIDSTNLKIETLANRLRKETAAQLAVAQGLEEQDSNSDPADNDPMPKLHGEERAQSVKVVLHIETDLATFERALAAVGVKRRGEAAVRIARHYLDNMVDVDYGEEVT